jgi:hypothetical protein
LALIIKLEQTMPIKVPTTLKDVLGLQGKTFEKSPGHRRIFIDRFFYNTDYWTHGSVYIRPSERGRSEQKITIQALLEWLDGAEEVK